MVETKRCSVCRKRRPLSDFAERPKNPTGRSGQCLRCEKAKLRDGARRLNRNQRRGGTPAQKRTSKSYEQGFRDGVAECRRHHAPAPSAELLKAAAALTHPDRHPFERRAEATRVTAELNVLRDRS
jgi:hypothetical protein